MRKFMFLVCAFALLFTLSCKKETVELHEKEKMSESKKMSGPECDDCDILHPAPGDDGFGGNCDVGVGNWIMDDSFRYARFYIRYERNPTTNLLEVTSMYSTHYLPAPGITVTDTGTQHTINQSTGIITGVFSLTIQRSPSEITPYIFNIWIDTCNGEAVFNM